MDRRQFLRSALAASAGAITGSNVITLWGGDMRALATNEHLFAPIAPGSVPILVVVEFEGGMDGLSLVGHTASPEYVAARPTLRINPAAVGALPLGDGNRYFHPALGNIKAQWDAGNVAVVEGIGESVAKEFSHFESFDNWWTATFNHTEPYGWIGRFNDVVNPTGTFASVSVGTTVKALRGQQAPTIQINNLNEFSFDP